MQNSALIEKIQKLPPDVVDEVEQFVDFLTERRITKSHSETHKNGENLPAQKNGEVDLRARGISREEAAVQRAALASFAEDWERPEMEIYDKL
jgi:hypothetical protein